MIAHRPDDATLLDNDFESLQDILAQMSAGKEFYDQDDVLETYLEHRQRPDNPNDAIERPLFLELVGDLKDLSIIDLGCGDARFGLDALQRGATAYTGIEIADKMATQARKALAGKPATIVHQAIEDWRFEGDPVDLVTSRLALHYVENLMPVFQQVSRALRPAGRFIVSVEHPVITSSFKSLENGRRTTWLVDDYFRPGPRPHQWLGQEVVKYHLSLEDYLDLIAGSGLELLSLRESKPRREHFSSEAEYERRLRIPLFLYLVARKPQAIQ